MRRKRQTIPPPVVYSGQLRLGQQLRHRDRTYYEISDNTARLLAEALSRPLPEEGFSLLVHLAPGLFPQGDMAFLQRVLVDRGTAAYAFQDKRLRRNWVWAIGGMV